MSEPQHELVRARQRDRGMTLPELLVSIVVLGAVVGVLSSSLIVIFRQRDNTSGRLDVAAAEQTVGMWVPADLASAVSVNTDPAATPCGTRPAPGVVPSTCPPGLDLSGSNAMLLTWTSEDQPGVIVTTNVSYHFSPQPGGLYQLSRIECWSSGGAWTCESHVVLHDLPGPPGGEPFVPGVTSPSWVILVSEPLEADATDPNQVAQPSSTLKNAKRVVVTINGGGDTSGAGGGINQISITAGGTTRSIIDANSLQGAPSFADAVSRCGGPMALVIDESNSIGNDISNVKTGVTAFIKALAGTPVTLQVVRFQTYATILGDAAAWTHYYNMLSESDVTTLLNAVGGLKGSWTGGAGGTNWEDALFHTFYNADGSTAATIPDTVVFFTDGVPTYDRLDYRQAPGVLPAQPPAPGPGWPNTTPPEYTQVGFNRANYIATQFRSSVKMIGVGVGGINDTSGWIANPGAGYHMQWQRGYNAYQKATAWTYEARYQAKTSSNGSYFFVTKAQYDTYATNRRKDLGWGTTITQSQYNSLESPPNTNDTDGVRRTPTTWTAITAAEFNAPGNNTTSTDADGYRPNPSGKQYASPYLEWEDYNGTRSGSQSQYRQVKVYSAPFDSYDAPVEADTVNSVILARLIAGNDNGVSAIWDAANGTYTNTGVADMYILPQWSQMDEALSAVALGKCGGTVTLQTKLGGTSPAPDPFTYQNSAVTDSDGQPVAIEPRVVKTNLQYTSGTFDFDIPSGRYVMVDIRPENLSNLVGYTPIGWTCKAGLDARTVTPIPVDSSPWSGIRVKVGANEAVSCILSVNRA